MALRRASSGERNRRLASRTERGGNYKWLGSRDRSVRMRPVFRREAPAQLHHDRMRCDPSRRRNYLRLPNPRLCNRRGRPHAQRGRGNNSQTGDLDLTHCGSPFVPWKHLNLAENPPPACDRCHKMAESRRPRALAGGRGAPDRKPVGARRLAANPAAAEVMTLRFIIISRRRRGPPLRVLPKMLTGIDVV